MSRRFFNPGVILFSTLVLFAALVTYQFYPRYDATAAVETIKDTSDRSVRASVYRSMIEHLGVVEAQEVLKNSGLPFDGETHLINHESGEYAYETYGARGILYCRDYFLSSCYHGFTIAFIKAEGIDRLGEVINICGTESQWVNEQCAHGIGHGLLAFVGYAHLPKAFAYCDTLGETYHTFKSDYCRNGVAMENNWALHDNGSLSPDRWVKEDDPTYPCTAPEIKEEWRYACWQNQASVAYQLFKGGTARVGALCASLDNATYQAQCFNNLARVIHSGSNGNLDTAIAECSSITFEGERARCLMTVADSEYSVGGRDIPFRICGEILQDTEQEACYLRLYNVIERFTPSLRERATACEKINQEEYRSACVLQTIHNSKKY